MSVKKSIKSPDALYIKRAKALKKYGIVKYDLRKKLTKGQKANLTKKWSEYRNVVDPKISMTTTRKKDYVVRTVKKEVANEIRKNGYKVYGNKVFISKDRYKKVSIKSRKNKAGKYLVEIHRTSVGKLSVERLYSKSGSIFDDIKVAMENRVLMPHMFVSVKIGSAENFTVNLPVDDYNELLKYLEKWQPKDDPAQRDALLSQMTLVYIYD